jgi:phytoene dehydrogenase-like protein
MMLPQRFETHYDAVIVGGGHNGLVAANYLSGAGLKVLLLEKETSLGGATASHRIFPDYDAQLSRYSYLVSLLPPSILEDLDIPFQTRRRSTASFTPYIHESGIASGLLFSNTDQSISRHSFLQRTSSADAWTRYQSLLELESCIAQLAWPSLTQPLRSRDSFVQSLETDLQRQAWNWFVERPIGEVIEHFIDDDLVRGLAMTDAKIGIFSHPHDPSLLQNRCFLYHVIGRGTGEWQVPVGGMGALVRGLHEGAMRRGAELVCDATVTRVAPNEKFHSLTFLHNDHAYSVDATRVLFNASPKNIAAILHQPWTPQATDEGSVVKVNMLLSRLPKIRATGVTAEQAFAGSLHINEGYNQMLASHQAAKAGVLPSPAPFEIYCHTLTDNSILSDELNQQGYHTLTLFGLDVPYRLFESDQDQRRSEILSRYLEGLDSICAEPFIDCLARDRSGNPCIEIKTPQDLQREISLDLGNIFHNTLSWFFTDDSEEVGKWGVETEESKIYRCGSSAMRGGAVSGIPGRNAAARIFEEIGIDDIR